MPAAVLEGLDVVYAVEKVSPNPITASMRYRLHLYHLKENFLRYA